MESLNILNGNMSPKYDKYNDIYSVNISSDVNSLELDYTIKENEAISVYGNLDFEAGDNKVIIAIKENEETNYVTLMVNKEAVETVSSVNDEYINLTIIKDDYIPKYAPHLIALSCFSIILLIFCLFYLRKRNN